MFLDFLLIVVIVAFLVGVTTFYVAGEFGLVTARKTRILQSAQDGNRVAQMLLPVLEDPEKLDNYIAASQVGITISSIALGIYGENALAPLLKPWLVGLPTQSAPLLANLLAGGAAATIVLLFLTTLHVVLGELVPKSLAIQYPEGVALATTIPMKWSAEYILRPLIIILNGSGRFILRLLRLEYEGEHTHIHSPEEIEILFSESHRGGLLDADERQLLHNAFRIGELSAAEVMVPRTRMVTTPVDASVADALRLATESAYSRILDYEEDLDHIMGFEHLKDLFRLHHSRQDADLRSVLRPAPYVPETAPAVEVWDTLNDERAYLAIVFDEYGGTAGMITQEDLIEELFGEVQDEFDDESALIRPAGAGRIVVRGDMLISSLNDQLEIALPTDAANTVGGLVLDELGRVPETGDMVEVGGIRFKVESVAGRSVREVSLEPSEDITPPLEGVAL
ncbi:MAG: hemolysin family protein [Ardenticatenaceae bacterium]